MCTDPDDCTISPQIHNRMSEEKAKAFRDEMQLAEDGKPEGTRESLAQCVRMLEEYIPEHFPANELGQVHFIRAVTESISDTITAYLENTKPSSF